MILFILLCHTTKMIFTLAPVFDIEKSKHAPARHKATLHVPQLQAVQRQHVLLILLLSTLVVV